MARRMPPPALMVGNQLTAKAILALLPLAIAPFWCPEFRAKLFLTGASFFLVLQCILAPARRRSSSTFLRCGAWVAYHAPFCFATHATANIYMLSSPEEMDILAWGIILCDALTPTQNMSAYSVADLRLSKFNNAKSLFQFLCLMATISRVVYVAKAFSMMTFVFILYVVLLQISARVLVPLTHSWAIPEPDAHDDKDVDVDVAASESDHDPSESDEDVDLDAPAPPPPDAVAAVSSYDDDDAPAPPPPPVLIAADDDANVEDDDNEVLMCYMFFQKMKQQWCLDGSISRDQSEWLVSEARQMLSREGGADSIKKKIERAFRVVEVQLAFLYDLSFTLYCIEQFHAFEKFPAYGTPTYLLNSHILWHFILRPIVIGLTLTLYRRSGLVLTMLALVVGFVRRPVFLACFLASDWGRVICAQRAGHEETGPPPIVDKLCHVLYQRRRRRYWQEMIGQYSVLLDCNRGSTWKAVAAHALAFAYGEWSPSISNTHHPEEEEAVSLPEDLKLQLGTTLAAKYERGELSMTNASQSLLSNSVLPIGVWLPTFRQKNHASTILIWHIATCYLEMDQLHGKEQREMSSQATSYYHIATKLSKYCAYLVACLPGLLPGDPRATSEAFQSVMKSTNMALKGVILQNDKYEKIKELDDVGQHESLSPFESGVSLGKHLLRIFPPSDPQGILPPQDLQKRWKVMADFWVETMLYIAPPNNDAETHIDMLARGGEFITHVWALLSNTNMVSRRGRRISVTLQGSPDEVILIPDLYQSLS